MRRKRLLTVLTNFALVCILLFVGIVCTLPPTEDRAVSAEGAYFKGKSKEGVSLTFNVYWGTEHIGGILNELDRFGAKATFFLGGSWADDNVETVKEIQKRGHEIGSHGYFHRDQDKLSERQNYEEIKASCDFLQSVTGVPVTLFAPPSGAYNKTVVSVAQSLGCRTVMWSKDTVDWRDKEVSVCFRRATENVGGGDIILMHPMAHTLSALPQILENYQEKGLRCITVSENLQDT